MRAVCVAPDAFVSDDEVCEHGEKFDERGVGKVDNKRFFFLTRWENVGKWNINGKAKVGKRYYHTLPKQISLSLSFLLSFAYDWDTCPSTGGYAWRGERHRGIRPFIGCNALCQMQCLPISEGNYY